MKNGDKKAEELLYRAKQKDGFDSDIAKIRSTLGIPRVGFKSKNQEKSWLEEYDQKIFERLVDEKINKSELDDEIVEFLKKYNLPLTAYQMIANYLLNNNRFIERLENSSLPCEICDTDREFRELEWIKNGKPFVIILVPSTSSKQDVINYLRKNWKRDVERRFKKKDPQYKRIRSSVKKDRDDLIIDLYKKEKAKKLPGYADIRVASAMTENEYPEVTAEIVRKVWATYQKRKK